jgi:cytochrome c oxidase assembly protein subunit 15
MATGTVSLSSRPAGILRDRLWAERCAWVFVAWNVLVALWGTVVRSTGSGAGCGDHWPLCNGQVIPLSPTVHTIIEFVHRVTVAGSIPLLILVVAYTFRSTVKGMAARVFAVLSAILLFNEAFLGAMLVNLGYVTGNRSLGRVFFLSIHLSNTLLMLAAMTLTAWMLGTGQRWSDLRAKGLDHTIAIIGLIATLFVGVSGSLAALGDTLFPASSLRAAFAQDLAEGSPWLLRLRGVHPLSAFIAGGFVIWLIVRASRTKKPRLAGLVIGLLAAQFVLGIADVILLAPSWMQVLHLLGADLFWVALIVTTAAILWPPRATTPA